MRAIVDALDLSELISDCADLPDTLLVPIVSLADVPAPPERQVHWHISDECLARITGLDDYGS